MLTGEHKELPAQQRQPARMALLTRLHNGVPVVEPGNVDADVGRRLAGVVHLLAQRVDAAPVVLERAANLLLEVVDDDEIREEGNQVLDAQQLAPLEKLNRRLDAAAGRLCD